MNYKFNNCRKVLVGKRLIVLEMLLMVLMLVLTMLELEVYIFPTGAV